jgi:Asp-tRNA(Asn)/Glu-tRNA(Gln) amidotransferase A subunit family amidase
VPAHALSPRRRYINGRNGDCRLRTWARAAGERGNGRIHITVKESFEVRGTPTTAGLTARKDHIATADAFMVSRIRQAGAVLRGKTNVPPLLLSTETSNPLYGRTNHPWDLESAPGGSSGGKGAILASRGSALGLGSDLGGNVRVPAHARGIHALRPA